MQNQDRRYAGEEVSAVLHWKLRGLSLHNYKLSEFAD